MSTSGKGIVRQGDSHIGHASPTPNPFHQTTYVSGQGKVYADGILVIRKGDSTSCGDPAVGSASKCYAGEPGNMKLIHRISDATGGHGSWVPNAAATGSGKCFAY
jgi:hypothetical protein